MSKHIENKSFFERLISLKNVMLSTVLGSILAVSAFVGINSAKQARAIKESEEAWNARIAMEREQRKSKKKTTEGTAKKANPVREKADSLLALIDKHAPAYSDKAEKIARKIENGVDMKLNEATANVEEGRKYILANLHPLKRR